MLLPIRFPLPDDEDFSEPPHPIDWLRRERVNQAKRRLTESSDAIEEIATQVGYNDRFFFSRDFNKLTGYSPREFRRREVHAGL